MEQGAESFEGKLILQAHHPPLTAGCSQIYRGIFFPLVTMIGKVLLAFSQEGQGYNTPPTASLLRIIMGRGGLVFF